MTPEDRELKRSRSRLQQWKQAAASDPLFTTRLSDQGPGGAWSPVHSGRPFHRRVSVALARAAAGGVIATAAATGTVLVSGVFEVQFLTLSGVALILGALSAGLVAVEASVGLAARLAAPPLRVGALILCGSLAPLLGAVAVHWVGGLISGGTAGAMHELQQLPGDIAELRAEMLLAFWALGVLPVMGLGWARVHPELFGGLSRHPALTSAFGFVAGVVTFGIVVALEGGPDGQYVEWALTFALPCAAAPFGAWLGERLEARLAALLGAWTGA